MTTSVQRILNMMFKIIAFIKIRLFVCLYVRVAISLTCRNHLYDHIITLRREVWAHNSSLTLSLFTEVFVPSQESEKSCICVLEVSILPLSTIFLLDFGTVPTVWYTRTVPTVWYFRTVLTVWYFRTVPIV
jgi:hypothetical protein